MLRYFTSHSPDATHSLTGRRHRHTAADLTKETTTNLLQAAICKTITKEVIQVIVWCWRRRRRRSVLKGRRRSLMAEIFGEEEVGSPCLCIVIGPLAWLPVTVYHSSDAVASCHYGLSATLSRSSVPQAAQGVTACLS